MFCAYFLWIWDSPFHFPNEMCRVGAFHCNETQHNNISWIMLLSNSFFFMDSAFDFLHLKCHCQSQTYLDFLLCYFLRAHTCANAYAHTDMYIDINTHECMHTDMCSHTHIHRHAHRRVHTDKQTLVQTHLYPVVLGINPRPHRIYYNSCLVCHF